MKSPWEWVRALFARRDGQDPTQQQRYVLPYPVAGINLTADESLSLAAVWACITVIAQSIGSCRWNIYTPLDNRREMLSEDPLIWLLNTRPNPDMTAIGWREAMLFVAIPFGNSYAEIVRDAGGRVVALWPLPYERVTPRRDPATWELVYEYRQPDGSVVILESSRVFHLRGPGLHGLMGENVIARAAKSLGVAAAQERHSAAYFGQGASPGGILKAPGEVNQQTYERLKEDWAEKKKGPENAHKPLILEAGWDFTTITNDPVKSQLVEARQFSVEEICRWFGVPPHKIQHLLRATFGNIEHQSIEFARDALTPWCRRLEQEADFKLCPQRRAPWKYTVIDTAPLTAGDALSRAQAYAVGRQNGYLTANEIRASEGLNSIGPNGDVLLVQSNLTTIELLINPPAPPAPVVPALPPGKDPAATEDAGDNATEDSGDAVARQALAVIVCAALERHGRRVSNRNADLQRNAPAGAPASIGPKERGHFFAQLEAEVALAEPFALRALGRGLTSAEIEKGAALVESGVLAAEVASKLLPASCPRPA